MPSTAPQVAGTPFIANFVHDPNYKSHFPGPIFEIAGVEGFEQDGGLVYRLNLSDGCHWIWGLIPLGVARLAQVLWLIDIQASWYQICMTKWTMGKSRSTPL